MFPFTKKKPEAQRETVNEQVRRRFDETHTRLGEAVRKMEEHMQRRQQCDNAPRCPNFAPLKLVK